MEWMRENVWLASNQYWDRHPRVLQTGKNFRGVRVRDQLCAHEIDYDLHGANAKADKLGLNSESHWTKDCPPTGNRDPALVVTKG